MGELVSKKQKLNGTLMRRGGRKWKKEGLGGGGRLWENDVSKQSPPNSALPCVGATGWDRDAPYNAGSLSCGACISNPPPGNEIPGPPRDIKCSRDGGTRAEDIGLLPGYPLSWMAVSQFTTVFRGKHSIVFPPGVAISGCLYPGAHGSGGALGYTLRPGDALSSRDPWV